MKKKILTIGIIAMLITMLVVLTGCGNENADNNNDNSIKNTSDNSKNNTEEVEIGEAINSDKYGWYVKNYKSSNDEEITWQLFYQDSNWTYIISEESVKNITLSKEISDDMYTNGSNDIDKNLIKLNKLWFDKLGSNSSTSANAKATAYMLDQNIWKDYKDIEGKAKYAIGGVTMDLFSASYNTTQDKKIYTSVPDENGYDTKDGYSNYGAVKHSMNNGLYNDGKTKYILTASPASFSDSFIRAICYGQGSQGFIGSEGTYTSGGIRPIVIIPTNSFNSYYELSNNK